MAHKRLALCGAVIAVLCSLSSAGPISSHPRARNSGSSYLGGDNESSSSFESATCNPHDSVFQAGQTYLFKYTATIESTLGDRAPTVFGTSSSSRLPWESQSSLSDNADQEEYEPTTTAMTSSSVDGAHKLPKIASLLTCKVELAMTDACKAELSVPQCKVFETSPGNELEHDPSQPIAAVLVAEQKPTAEQHEQLVRQAFAQHASEDSSSQQLSALISRYPVKALIKHGQVVALKAHKKEATAVLNIKRAILDTLQFNQQRAEQVSGRVEGESQRSSGSSKKEKSIFGECPTKYSPSMRGDGYKIEKNLSKCSKLHMSVSGKTLCHVETRQNSAAPFSVVCVSKQVLAGAYNNTKMTPVQPVILTTRSIKPDTSASPTSGRNYASDEQSTDSSSSASFITTTLAFEPVDETTAAEQLAAVLDTEANQQIVGKIDQVLEKLVQVTLKKEAVTPKSVELFQTLLVKIKTVKNIEPLVNEIFSRCPAKMSSHRDESAECPLELKIKRDYLLQALIQTPTKAAMQAIMTLINNDQIERAIYEPLLYTAAFVKFAKQTTMATLWGSSAAHVTPASYDYLTKMVEVCQQKPTRYCVLGLSTIAHEVFKMVVVNAPEEQQRQDIPTPVKRAVEFLVQLVEPGQCQPSDVLRRAHELTETDAVLLALKAWGNAGNAIEAIVPEFAEQYVVPCIQKFTTGQEGASRSSYAARRPSAQENDSLNRKQRRFESAEEENTSGQDDEDYTPSSGARDGQYPVNVTWSAVFALRRTSPTEPVKRMLFDLVLSERVSVEPRIAAVIQLTRFLTPQDQEIISHILQTVRSEQPSGSSTTHVWSFIVSHWKNLLRSSDPYYKPIADVITKIEPEAYEILRQVERKITEKRRGTFSRAYEICMIYELPFPVPGYSSSKPTFSGESTSTSESPRATVGFQYEQAWIFTPHSYLPTFVLTNFSLGTFSEYFNAIEVGVDFSEVEQQLERTFGRQSAALVPLKQLFGVVYNMFNRVVSSAEDVWYKLAVDPSHLLQTVVRAWQEYKQTGNVYGRKVSIAQVQQILSSAAHAVQTGDKEPLIQEIERLMPARSQFDVRSAMHKIDKAAKRMMSVTNRPLSTEDVTEMLAAIGVPQQITQQLLYKIEQMTGGQQIDTVLRAIQTLDVERLVQWASKMVDATVMKRVERLASQLLDGNFGAISGGNSFNMPEDDSTDIPSAAGSNIRKLLLKLSRMISRVNVGVYVKVAGNEVLYTNVHEIARTVFERVPKFIAQRQQQLQRQMQSGSGQDSLLSEMLPMMNIQLFDFDMPIPTASGLQLTTGVRTILSTAVKTGFVAKNAGSQDSAKEFVIKVEPSFVLLNEVVLLKVGLPGIFGAKLSSKMSLSHKSDFGFYGKKPTTGSKKNIQFGIVLPEEPVVLLQFEQKLVHKVGMAAPSEHKVALNAPQVKRICTPQPLQAITKMRTCVELSSPSQALLNSLSSFRNMYGSSDESSNVEDEQEEYEPSSTGRRASKYAQTSRAQEQEDELETADENEPWSTTSPSNVYSMSKKYWKKYMKLYKAIIVGPTKLRLIITPKPEIRSKALVLIAKADKSAASGESEMYAEQDEQQFKPSSSRRHAHERRQDEQQDETHSAHSDETKIQPTDAFTVKLVLKDVAHLVEQISSGASSRSKFGPSSNDENDDEERDFAHGNNADEERYEPTARRHHATEEHDDEDDSEDTPPIAGRSQTGADDSSTDKAIATGRLLINRNKKAVVVELKLKNNQWTKNKKLVLFAKPQADKAVQGVSPGKGYKIAVQLVDPSAQSETGRHAAPCEIFAHIIVRKSGSSATFEQDEQQYAPVEEEQSNERRTRSSAKFDTTPENEQDDEESTENIPSSGSISSLASIVKPEANITLTYGIQLPQKFIWVTKNSLLKKQQKIWVEHEVVYGVSPRAMPQSLKFFVEKAKELVTKFKQQAAQTGLIVDGAYEGHDYSSAAGSFFGYGPEEGQSSSSSSFKPIKIKLSYGVDAKRPSSYDQTDDVPAHAEGKIKTLRLFTSLKTYCPKTGAPEPIVVLVQDIAVDVRSFKYVKLSSKAVWRSLFKKNTMSLAKIEWKWQNKSNGNDESARSKVEYQLTIENPLAVADLVGAMKKSSRGSSDETTCHTSNRVGIVFAPLFAGSASEEPNTPFEDEQNESEIIMPARNRRAAHSGRRAHEQESAEEEESETAASSGRGLRKERVALRKVIGDVDEELTKLRRQYFGSKKNTMIVEVFPRKLAAQQQLIKFNVSMVTVTTPEDGSSAADSQQQWFTSSPSRQQHHELSEQSAAGRTRFNTEVVLSVKPAHSQDRLVQVIHLTTNMEAKVLGKNVLKTSLLAAGGRHRRQQASEYVPEDDSTMSSTGIPSELIKIAFDTVGTIVSKRIPDEELARQQQEQPFKFIVPRNAERQHEGKEDIVMSGLFKIHSQKGLMTRLHIDSVLPKLNAAALMSSSSSSRQHSEEEFEAPSTHGKKIRVSQFMEVCPTRQKFIVSLNVTSPMVQLKSYGQIIRPLQVGGELYWFSESEPRGERAQTQTGEILAMLLTHRASAYGKMEQVEAGESQATFDFEHAFLTAKSQMSARFVPAQQLLQKVLNKIESNPQLSFVESSPILSQIKNKLPQLVEKVTFLRKVLLPTNINMDGQVLIKNSAQPEILVKLTTKNMHVKGEVSLKAAQMPDQKFIVDFGKLSTEDKLVFIAKLKHIPSEKALAVKIGFGAQGLSHAEDNESEETADEDTLFEARHTSAHGGPRVRRQQQAAMYAREDETTDSNKKVLFIALEQQNILPQQGKSKLLKIELSLKKDQQYATEQDSQDEEDDETEPSGSSSMSSRMFANKKLAIKMIIKPAPLVQTLVKIQQSTLKTAIKLVDVVAPDQTIDDIAQKLEVVLKEPRNPLAKLALNALKIVGIKPATLRVQPSEATLEQVLTAIMRKTQRSPIVKLAAHYLDVAPQQLTPLTLAKHVANLLKSQPLSASLLAHDTQSSTPVPKPIETIIRSWDKVLKFVGKALDMTAGRYASRYMSASADEEQDYEVPTGRRVQRDEQDAPTVELAQLVRKMLKQTKKDVKTVLISIKQMSEKPENLLLMPLAMPTCVAVKKANELEVSTVAKALVKITFATLEQIKRDSLRLLTVVAKPTAGGNYGSEEYESSEMPTGRSINFQLIGEKLIKLIPHKLPQCPARFSKFSLAGAQREQESSFADNEDSSAEVNTQQAVETIIKFIDVIARILPVEDLEVENVPEQQALKIKAQVPIAAKQIKKIARNLEKILSRMDKNFTKFQSSTSSFWSASAMDSNEDDITDNNEESFSSRRSTKGAESRRGASAETDQSNTEEYRSNEERGAQQQLKRSLKQY